MEKKRKKHGGRQKGTLNKVTSDVRELALDYGPGALRELVRLSQEADAESVRVSACKEILDRAYGKAPQSIEYKDETDRDDIPSDLEVVRRLVFLLDNAVEGNPLH